MGAEQRALFAEAETETPGFAFVVRSMRIDFELETLGQQLGNEAPYSAWKSPDFRNVFNSHSDIS